MVFLAYCMPCLCFVPFQEEKIEAEIRLEEANKLLKEKQQELQEKKLDTESDDIREL